MTIYEQLLSQFDIESIASKLCRASEAGAFGKHFVCNLMINNCIWELWIDDEIEGGRANHAGKILTFGPQKDHDYAAGIVVHEIYHAMDPVLVKVGQGIYGWWEKLYIRVQNWAAKYNQPSIERWLIDYLAMAVIQCRHYFSTPEIRAYFYQTKYLGWFGKKARGVYKVYFTKALWALGYWPCLIYELGRYLREKRAITKSVKRLRDEKLKLVQKMIADIKAKPANEKICLSKLAPGAVYSYKIIEAKEVESEVKKFILDGGQNFQWCLESQINHVESLTKLAA